VEVQLRNLGLPFCQGEKDNDTLPDNDDWPMLLSGASQVQIELIPSAYPFSFACSQKPKAWVLTDFVQILQSCAG
jgi:hypothetical protein